MPYKHNLWGNIVRKSNYYKAALANFRSLRPVHSVQTGSQFLNLVPRAFLRRGEDGRERVFVL